MREIKFRAWHKDSKIMFDVNGMSPTAAEEKRNGMNFVYSRGDVVLMQYTGLRDRNGKEIFEGDIAEHNGKLKSVVEYIADDAGFKLINKRMGKMHMDYEYFSRYVKVVGNIFENSEMLEEEKLCR